jgi:hypothetical protein
MDPAEFTRELSREEGALEINTSKVSTIVLVTASLVVLGASRSRRSRTNTR